MSEPERETLSAPFIPGVALEVSDLETVDEPFMFGPKLDDLSAADRFLCESHFRRVEEWVLDDDEYFARVEYLGEDEAIADNGAETARLIDLTTAGDVTHGPVKAPSQRAVETSHGTLDQGVDLE